jgi:hypothetical protein
LDRIEKIVWMITGLAVLAVIAFAAIGPLKSEVSDETIDHEFKMNNPDFGKRPRFNPGAPQPVAAGGLGGSTIAAAPGGRQPGGRVAAPVQQAGARPASSPQTPGAPPPLPNPPAFQPLQQGNTGNLVNPQTPIVIPENMAAKYQHFEDVVQLGMTGYGEDVTLPDGSTGFQLQEIQEGSPLADRLGFQAGDTIISVNGYPASKSNAHQLYDTLKNESTFNVVVLRGGQQMTMTYNRR